MFLRVSYCRYYQKLDTALRDLYNYQPTRQRYIFCDKDLEQNEVGREDPVDPQSEVQILG